jgi:ribosomal-protein-alanine N-acetyltransferase
MSLPALLRLDDASIHVRLLASDDEARACAGIMASSDPWVTLGRGFEKSLAILRDESQERWVAVTEEGEVVGFVLLIVQGAFVGYIRTIAIREDWRSRGLGRRLIELVEERVHRESPNVFLCVSSFNERARALYERLGYRVVGELPDHIVRGHSEWLLRKSLGAITEWRGALDRSAAAGEVSSTVQPTTVRSTHGQG